MTIDLSQRLFDSTLGALELLTVHLGRELGLYDDLARHGAATPAQLAERCGIAERYAREWLEQQAVAGYLTVAAPSEDASQRAYALPEENRGALVDPIDGDHVAPFAAMVAGIAGVLPDLVAAYRTGAGVPYASYGQHFRHGQGGINRPAFTNDLVKAWLPAVEGIDRLLDGGVVLDVGTGHGWSAIAVQAAWPAAQVIGVDTDEASIADARHHAEEAGVKVRFEVARRSDGTELTDFGAADVVLILESLHDMARPVEVLSAARAALAPGGLVIVADEAVAETYSAPGDDLERMMYGWSVLHCLPASLAEQPSAAIGTVIRPGTVRDLASEAGFTACDIVDVDGGFFNIYRLAV